MLTDQSILKQSYKLQFFKNINLKNRRFLSAKHLDI